MKRKNYTYTAILITYILLIIGIVGYLLFLKNFISIPECPFYKHLGIYCPACGGTRAIIALSHFNIIDSFLYNPIVIYSLVFSTFYLIIETINLKFKKSISLPWKILVFVGLSILFINWIIQNILLFNS